MFDKKLGAASMGKCENCGKKGVLEVTCAAFDGDGEIVDMTTRFLCYRCSGAVMDAFEKA